MKVLLLARQLLFFNLVCACFSSFVFASEATDETWRQQLELSKLPPDEQAYCYTEGDHTLQGIHLNLRVRLASVSKLVTSLWSLYALGAEFKFKTRLFIQNKALHFEGSLDPFLGNEKMYFLLSQLNDLGFTHFDRVTFDKNFIVFPNAQGYNEEHPVITPEKIANNLLRYFNTDQWTPAMKSDYLRVQRLAGLGRMRKEIVFSVTEVHPAEENPLPGNEDVRTLTLSSPPLYRYLKEMNVESNNYVAQLLFLQLGGEHSFSHFLQDTFGLGDQTLHFWSGSGLPTMIQGRRYDNYATCSSMLRLMMILKEKIEKDHYELEDILAVPGSDEGTFRNRTFPADYKNAFVAKTGTLVHTSTIAGALNTKSGLSFFGIFNQTSDINHSKKVQNIMIDGLMSELGGPKAFNYTVLPFDPFGDNVKNLLGVKSNFLPIEENLY